MWLAWERTRVRSVILCLGPRPSATLPIRREEGLVKYSTKFIEQQSDWFIGCMYWASWAQVLQTYLSHFWFTEALQATSKANASPWWDCVLYSPDPRVYPTGGLGTRLSGSLHGKTDKAIGVKSRVPEDCNILTVAAPLSIQVGKIFSIWTSSKSIPLPQLVFRNSQGCMLTYWKQTRLCYGYLQTHTVE